jgi:hypothetical protein
MILRQCGEQVFYRGVVAEGLAEVLKTINVAGSEDEAATELEGIFGELVHVLAMSAGFGALAPSHVVTAKDMQQVRLAESGGFVSLAVGVDEQRKRDAAVFAETAGVIDVAESDGGESSATLAESRFEFAQLRDVFPAEDSTVMPQEHDDRRVVGPQCAELDGVAVGVRQGDGRELAAEGGSHCGAILVRRIGAVNNPFACCSFPAYSGLGATSGL